MKLTAKGTRIMCKQGLYFAAACVVTSLLVFNAEFPGAGGKPGHCGYVGSLR